MNSVLGFEYANKCPEVLTHMNDLFSLDHKLALVTGSGKVPHAIAALFRKAGATVIHDEQPTLTESGVAASLNSAGGIDILVNGSIQIGAYPLEEMTLERWDRIHSTNVRGAFLLMREAVRVMKAHGRGGRIINISTIGSVHPVLHGNYAYTSSRAGTNALTRQFALDFGKDGINTNAILVGPVISDPPAEGAPPPSGPGVSKERLPGGIGLPEDIAPAALLLAADGPGRFINGSTIVIDGGFLIA